MFSTFIYICMCIYIFFHIHKLKSPAYFICLACNTIVTDIYFRSLLISYIKFMNFLLFSLCNTEILRYNCTDCIFLLCSFELVDADAYSRLYQSGVRPQLPRAGPGHKRARHATRLSNTPVAPHLHLTWRLARWFRFSARILDWRYIQHLNLFVDLYSVFLSK